MVYMFDLFHFFSFFKIPTERTTTARSVKKDYVSDSHLGAQQAPFLEVSKSLEDLGGSKKGECGETDTVARVFATGESGVDGMMRLT